MTEAWIELTAQLNFTSNLYSTYISLCVVNGLFSIIASFGNLFVILAIYRNRTLHTPSYVLLSALALSDLGIGAIAQPLYIIFKYVEIRRNVELYCILGIVWHMTALFLAGFSFMTITSISIDRYLAVYLSTKYRQVVTVRRTVSTTVLLALVALAISSMYVVHMKANLFAQTFVILLCLFVTSFNSLKIIRTLRQHQKVHARTLNTSCQSRTSRFFQRNTACNIYRFKKSVNILLYVYGAFLLCYTPYLCYRIVLNIIGRTATVHGAFSVCSTIVFINSSLNPTLYLWRIPEIRAAVFKILRIKIKKQKQELEQTISIQSKWHENENYTTINTQSLTMNHEKIAWNRIRKSKFSCPLNSLTQTRK